MKRSVKLTVFVVSALLGACSSLPFAQPTPTAKPKPKPRPAAAQQQPLAIPPAPTQSVTTSPLPVVPSPATSATASAPPPTQFGVWEPVPSAAAEQPPAVTTAPASAAPTTSVPLTDKSDPDARFKAALDLLKQNQPQEAEAVLNELSRDFPQFSGPFTELGILYAKSKRVQPAIAAFTRATTANPQNALAYNWLGILQRESKDYVRAEQAYQKALAINPNHAAANLNLGILYDAYLSRPHDALPYYRNYQRLGGQDDLRVLVWIAQIEKLPPPAPVAVPSIVKPVTPASKPTRKPQTALPGMPATQEHRQ